MLSSRVSGCRTRGEWALGRGVQGPGQGRAGIHSMAGWIGGAGWKAGGSGRNEVMKQVGHQAGTEGGGKDNGWSRRGR